MTDEITLVTGRAAYVPPMISADTLRVSPMMANSTLRSAQLESGISPYTESTEEENGGDIELNI